jgi:hypothetical protein
MALYLCEHEVGFDTAVIGYPSIGDCMAFALVTTQGIYGWHCMPGHEKRVNLFNDFIQETGDRGLHVTAYASFKMANRSLTWENDLRTIAAGIHYDGTIRTYNTAEELSDSESTYSEYRWVSGGDVTVHHKRDRKMKYDGGTLAPGALIKKIGPQKDGGKTFYALGGSSGTVATVSVVETWSNKGETHQVPVTGFKMFFCS